MPVSRAPTFRVLAQSAVAVPLTGTTSKTLLATIAIPAGAMGANGRVGIKAFFSNTNNANNKTPEIKFGATTIYSNPTASNAQQSFSFDVSNRNVTNSQVSNSLAGSFGVGGSAVVTAAIDTTASVDITISGTLAVGTDTMTLESYQVVLYPKA